MKRLIILMAAVMLVMGVVITASADYIPADIVWIIDRSGSMSDDATNIKTSIDTFNSNLAAAGIDAHYALVMYSEDPLLQQDLTSDLFGFKSAMDTAIAGMLPSIYIENAYEAVDSALPGGLYDLGISFRQGAVKDLILVTDEDADDWGDGYSDKYSGDLGALLDSNDALLNIIYDSSWSDATNDFEPIARPSGALFSLVDFENDPQSFINTFSQVKIKEIQEHVQVPEPTTLLLLGSGLIGLAAFSRRKMKK